MAKFKDRAFSNDEIEAWNTVLVTHEKSIAHHANRIITIFDGRVKEDLMNSNKVEVA